MRHPHVFSGYCIFSIFLLACKVQAQKTPDSLSNFSFSSLNGDSVSNNLFDNGRPLILFYFDPTCSHCEKQAQWISKSIEQFEGVDLLWLAWEVNDAISSFRKNYFSQATDNVYFAVDVDYRFDGIFGFSEIPTVFIFDDRNSLLKTFNGETKVEKLLKILEINSK